jgi:outer membrane lipoprotein-sorting protein
MIRYLFILLLFSFRVANAQTAKEIIQKADEKMRGNSSKSEMVMTIIRPEWSREVGIKSWSFEDTHSLILITAPARDKGAAFLKREKEIWNWQPRIERVIKLPPSMMMQSWMGSDFTNDDLVKESSIVKDYEHELKGDTTIGEYEAHKIVLIPHEDAAVVWGRIEAYIEMSSYFQLLLRYYDEDGYLVNTMKLSNIREIGGRIIPTHLEMIPADDPGHKTTIDYKEIAFNIDIPESFFSLQNLKRIR